MWFYDILLWYALILFSLYISTYDSFFFNKLFYFWLCWVFVAARGLSLVAVSGATLRCGAQGSHCSGFSRRGAQALGAWASVVVARGSRAQAQ